MPYIGRGLTTGAQYQKLDDIAINNATTFTMSVGSANVSPDQNHLILVVNGVMQEPGTGFTVAGSTCTLASAITTSGHSGLDTIYGVIAGDAAFAAYDSIGANALGVTAGTAAASKAVVLDGSKNIATLGTIGSGAITATGSSSFATSIKTPLIEYTDGDNAITIADGGGITAAAGITSTAASNSFGATAFSGAVTTNSTIDGIDIATRDAVLTSTTTTAGAALPKAGGTMTGNIVMGDDTSIGIADDAERIEFDGAGDISVLGANFGIGTTSPDTELHVESTSDVQQEIRVQNSTTRLLMGVGDSSNNRFTGSVNSSGYIGTIDSQAMEFATANTTRMVISSAGKVGIGTTSIDGTLHLDAGTSSDLVIEKDAAGAASVRFHNAGSQVSYIQLDSDENMTHYGGSGIDQIFYAGGAERMRIVSDGQVKIAGSVANQLLYVEQDNTSNEAVRIYGPAATSATVAILNVLTNNGADANTGLRVMQNGSVGIGTASPGRHLQIGLNQSAHTYLRISSHTSYEQGLEFAVNGTAVWQMLNTSADVLAIYDVSDSSTAASISAGDNDWQAGSDLRIKKDIVNIDSTLDKINKLRPITWKRKYGNLDRIYPGLVAQEVLPHFPLVVGGTEDSFEEITEEVEGEDITIRL